jgi:hypothetical protein
MHTYTDLSRAEFMEFFRDDEKLNELTVDDRIEVFSEVLVGSSDITKELLDAVISDYGVSNLVVLDLGASPQKQRQ